MTPAHDFPVSGLAERTRSRRPTRLPAPLAPQQRERPLRKRNPRPIVYRFSSAQHPTFQRADGRTPSRTPTASPASPKRLSAGSSRRSPPKLVATTADDRRGRVVAQDTVDALRRHGGVLQTRAPGTRPRHPATDARRTPLRITAASSDVNMMRLGCVRHSASKMMRLSWQEHFRGHSASASAMLYRSWCDAAPASP